jgi:hypothetical protein
VRDVHIWSVQSSTIERVGFYVDETAPVPEVLVIGFHGGLAYRYFGVPLQLAFELAAAESVGSFLATRIKGQYFYDRLETEEAGELWSALGGGAGEVKSQAVDTPEALIAKAAKAVEGLANGRPKAMVLTKLDEARLWLTEVPR